MSKQMHISRRTILRGVGASLALPLLEAMTPGLAFGGTTPAKAPPKRMAFVYVPNGVMMQDWTPKRDEKLVELTPTLEPLSLFKDKLTVLTGLTVDKARPHGDGPGDHARAMSAFLTGSQPRKTAGADIKAGISVDQLAAQKLGERTKFPSLEIGCEGGKQAGNCDSGYSCAYSSTVSWRTESSPVPKEIDPHAVFERLFGSDSSAGGEQNRARRERQKKSILDFVAEDANRLRGKLGATDQRKVDEYLSSVRELERRVRFAANDAVASATPAPTHRPLGIPKDYGEHIRLMADMMALAFQADLTRISTFVFANEGSNRSYRLIGVPDGHHDLSHHGNNKEKTDKIQQINRFHIMQFSYLLAKLDAMKEGSGTVLDNCMIVYGSGNSDGNRHNHDDLPVLLAGKGGGTIQPGRHLRYPKDTPVTNLFVAMMQRMGMNVDSFGDSTGSLHSLS